jgi:hypothetical protein
MSLRLSTVIPVTVVSRDSAPASQGIPPSYAAEDGTPARSSRLTGTQATPSGVVLDSYEVGGPLATG